MIELIEKLQGTWSSEFRFRNSYHRKLRRLVVIDLKLGDFKAGDKGQMELYLRWLEKYEMQDNEEVPLGLILCAGKSSEKIELLQLDQSGIHVANYLTELPPTQTCLTIPIVILSGESIADIERFGEQYGY